MLRFTSPAHNQTCWLYFFAQFLIDEDEVRCCFGMMCTLGNCWQKHDVHGSISSASVDVMGMWEMMMSIRGQGVQGALNSLYAVSGWLCLPCQLCAPKPLTWCCHRSVWKLVVLDIWGSDYLQRFHCCKPVHIKGFRPEWSISAFCTFEKNGFESLELWWVFPVNSSYLNFIQTASSTSTLISKGGICTIASLY